MGCAFLSKKTSEIIRKYNNPQRPARTTVELFRSIYFKMLEWPSQSPELKGDLSIRSPNKSVGYTKDAY